MKFLYFQSKMTIKLSKSAITCVLSGLLGYLPVSAQIKAPVESKPEALFSVFPTLAFHLPGGNLTERFGSNFTAGPGIQWKSKSNWVLSGDMNFIFGNNIRQEGLIQNLLTSDGFVIGDDGRIAKIVFFERGFHGAVRVGKIFTLKDEYPNSGIYINAGAGFLQHKIKINVEQKTVSSLKGDYLKGYDRLTNGFSCTQFIGYMHFGKSRLYNYFLGVEIVEGWTRGRRPIHFDTMQRETGQRFDLLVGVKAGWMIPFRKRLARDYFYY